MAKKIKISNEEIIEFEEKENNNVKNKKTYLTISIVFNVIFICLIIIGYFYFNNNLEELENENSKLTNENSKLVYDSVSSELKASQLDELLGDKSYYYIKNKLDDFDKDIIFKIKGKGNYYYSYDCMMKFASEKTITFWAYNKEQAKDLGLKKGSC